ncbi:MULTISPECIES: hypothetical protein [Hyphobacterium]|uniref:Uncharacterized protein n=1 Tax=Hyphobacterium vulgare TaxID=1736751 RepID=A0ABV6ZW50_9PROT
MRLVLGLAQITIAVLLVIQNVRGFAMMTIMVPLEQWIVQMWLSQFISFSIAIVMMAGGVYLIRDFGLFGRLRPASTQTGDPR